MVWIHLSLRWWISGRAIASSSPRNVKYMFYFCLDMLLRSSSVYQSLIYITFTFGIWFVLKPVLILNFFLIIAALFSFLQAVWAHLIQTCVVVVSVHRKWVFNRTWSATCKDSFAAHWASYNTPFLFLVFLALLLFLGKDSIGFTFTQSLQDMD